MQNKKRITIVGLGGVGGFYGGLLANKYQDSNEVEICFVARGKHLEAIKQSGLKVLSKDHEVVGHPAIATSDWKDIQDSDYIILATKGYDLSQTIQDMKAVVAEKTVIIPLLNGVEAYEQLRDVFGVSRVWQGCTYMVSRLKEPGVIDNPSGRQRILFGTDGEVSSEMKDFETILKEASVHAEATNEISKEVWEKYILVSSSAMATAYFDSSFGGVMEHHPEEMKQLITEACSIGKKKGVALSEDVVEVIMERLKAIPYESTTSMHSDFKALKEHNELGIMGGYMVKQGIVLGVETPMYKKMCTYLVAHSGDKYVGIN
ncbi:ketopantoate reductase family protein [Myroides marinus]|uniref:ketopantoate reductase family protein n=1 Tax=Myroides marinus TaxID=703342 RepID=UPI000741A5F6|nr:2-dehydropantoate 2-reductase [Myroides marinus]KUF42998.1 2-dehydropantoate 2-reductase [Myroides marinus]MDM1369813.1 2-dehydropantoate 2-reductase [Myroides marinus]MDM1371653.1 2-dehydropantoate 2-reductase [Myroides marinus]MDM1383707.1 2-dehydropantoate 2-reductase [Myroides marinus]MDM1532165.1 2-dehydropantoate 2-reductase [Myroides marinus]